jgi:hypothetical protein
MPVLFSSPEHFSVARRYTTFGMASCGQVLLSMVSGLLLIAGLLYYVAFCAQSALFLEKECIVFLSPLLNLTQKLFPCFLFLLHGHTRGKGR